MFGFKWLNTKSISFQMQFVLVVCSFVFWHFYILLEINNEFKKQFHQAAYSLDIQINQFIDDNEFNLSLYDYSRVQTNAYKLKFPYPIKEFVINSPFGEPIYSFKSDSVEATYLSSWETQHGTFYLTKDWQTFIKFNKTFSSEKNKTASTLVTLQLNSLTKAVLYKLLYHYMFIIIFLFLQVFVILFLVKKLMAPLKTISNIIKENPVTTTSLPISIANSPEIVQFIESFNRHIDRIDKYQLREKENEKFAAIGQTTAILAHDVRKPFSQIKILLSILNQIKDDPSSINKAIKDIDSSVKHVESMLSDIMDFSREVKLDVEPTSIVSIVELSLNHLGKTIEKKDVTFNYFFSNSKKAMVDPIRLSRVLINVISNAIDAVKEKGVINITCYDIMANEKNNIRLIISNNGPFIQEDDLQKIFEPFFTKNKSRGTGLGLASAKKILSLHDGSIFAKNNTENNTVEFIITIPASEELDSYTLESLPRNLDYVFFPKTKSNSWQIERAVQNLKNSGFSFKILLLEDEPLYRASVKNIIKQIPELSAMITLYDAKSYDEALTLVKYENITHAIVDVDLGGEKDGFDFLQSVAQNDKKIKSMIHSNRHLDTFRQRSFELGAKSFVPKPLTLENLLDFLEGSSNELLGR